MPKTSFLNLDLTTDENTRFEDWQKALNGEGDGTEENPYSNMQIIDNAIQKIYGTSGEVTLTASNWQNNSYALNISKLGVNDAVFFTPANLTSKTVLESANVFISSNASIVTFSAQTAPTQDIILAYFIARGA